MSADNIERIFAGPAGWALVLGVGGVVVYLIYNRVKKDAAAAAGAIGGLATGNNVITNTATDWSGAPVDAYQNKGVLGTLGAATNAVSGGSLASLGDWIGGKLADLTQSYDPNAAVPDKNSPPVSQSIVSNPVTPSPSVLPYSYKQDTIDTPAALGTDQVFTPGYDTSSSGAYLDYTPGLQ